MKKKVIRKIQLNKTVISRLEQNKLNDVKGGFLSFFNDYCMVRTTSDASSNANKKCTVEDYTTQP